MTAATPACSRPIAATPTTRATHPSPIHTLAGAPPGHLQPSARLTGRVVP